MSKSVLVIDTPERCIDCEIGQNYSSIIETWISCPIAGKSVLDGEAESIPDWCPLMDLPEKDNGDYPANTFDAGFVEGWNQCIDEITAGLYPACRWSDSICSDRVIHTRNFFIVNLLKGAELAAVPLLKCSGVQFGHLFICQFSYSVHSTSTYMLY